jgi:hypothetical protein
LLSEETTKHGKGTVGGEGEWFGVRMPNRNQARSSTSITYYYALFDFDGTQDTHLSLKDGDILSIVEADGGDGWTCAHRLSDKMEGWVPSSYLEIYPYAIEESPRRNRTSSINPLFEISEFRNAMLSDNQEANESKDTSTEESHAAQVPEVVAEEESHHKIDESIDPVPSRSPPVPESQSTHMEQTGTTAIPAIVAEESDGESWSDEADMAVGDHSLPVHATSPQRATQADVLPAESYQNGNREEQASVSQKESKNLDRDVVCQSEEAMVAAKEEGEKSSEEYRKLEEQMQEVRDRFTSSNVALSNVISFVYSWMHQHHFEVPRELQAWEGWVNDSPLPDSTNLVSLLAFCVEETMAYAAKEGEETNKVRELMEGEKEQTLRLQWMTEVQSLQSELLAANRAKAQLEVSMKEEVEKCRSEVEELKQTLAWRDRERDTLRAEREQEEAQKENRRSEQAQRLASWQEERTRLQTQKVAAELDRDKWQGKWRESESELGDVRRLWEESVATQERFGHSLVQVERNLSHKETELEQTRRLLETEAEDHKSCILRAERAESKLREERQSRLQGEEVIREQTVSAATQQQMTESFRQLDRQARDELQLVREENVSLSERCTYLNEAFLALEIKNVELQSECQSLRAEFGRLVLFEKKASSSSEQLSLMEETLIARGKELADLHQQLEVAEQTMTRAQQESDTLKHVNKELLEENRSLLESLSLRNEEQQQLRRQLVKASTCLKDEAAKVSSFVQIHSKTGKVEEEELAGLRSTNQQLHDRVRLLSSLNIRLESRVRTLESDLECLSPLVISPGHGLEAAEYRLEHHSSHASPERHSSPHLDRLNSPPTRPVPHQAARTPKRAPPPPPAQ